MDLYSSIISIESLNSAWKEIKNKAAGAGIDEISFKLYEVSLESKIADLNKRLSDHSYVPKPALKFKIPKDNDKKEYRDILVSAVEDRIVQKSFTIISSKICEKFLSRGSFAYRKGRGHHHIVDIIRKNIKDERFRFCACMDIHNYFNSIDIDLLIKIFHERTDCDENTLKLISLWTKCGYFDNNVYHEHGSGLNLGYIISPFLSNIYLHDFDKRFDHSYYIYLRYADNIIFLADSLEKAETLYRQAEEMLKTRYNLVLNEEDKQIKDSEKGFDFLGLNFSPKVIKIADSKVSKAKRKIYKIFINKNNSPEKCVSEVNKAVEKWKYHYYTVTGKEQFELLDDHILKNLAKKLYFKRQLNFKHLTDNLKVLSDSPSLLLEKKVKNYMDDLFNKPVVKSEDIIQDQRKQYKKKLDLRGEWLVLKHGTKITLKDGKICMECNKFSSVVEISKINALQIGSKNNTVSTNLIEVLANKGIPIYISNHQNLPIAQILPAKHSSLNKTKNQISAYFNGKAQYLIKELVTGKIKNQKQLMVYYAKYWLKKSKSFSIIYKEFCKRTDDVLQKVSDLECNSYEELQSKVFGLEGITARYYWDIFAFLIKPVEFPGRIGHGAQDKVNAMINYGYGILYNKIHSELIKHSLNPQISYLHKDQEGKPTLVFDLIEQFRSPAVDRTVIAILNKKIEIKLDQNNMLDEKSRKILSKYFMDRIHTYYNYKTTETSIGEQISYRIKLLDDYLQNKDEYKSYIMKS